MTCGESAFYFHGDDDCAEVSLRGDDALAALGYRDGGRGVLRYGGPLARSPGRDRRCSCESWGAHNMESRDTRMESHLIDGVLALDAGGLTRALPFDEQRRIRAVILSHRHLRPRPRSPASRADHARPGRHGGGLRDRRHHRVGGRQAPGREPVHGPDELPEPGQPGAAAQHRRLLSTVRRARLHGGCGARSPLGAGRGVPDSLRRHTAVLHRRHGQRRQRRVGARLAHGAADRGDLRQRERVEGYSRGAPHPAYLRTRSNGSGTGTAICPVSSSPT